MTKAIEIRSKGIWVKVIQMLQQNWAIVETADNGEATIFFINDAGGVFDQIVIASLDEARFALIRNGFHCFNDDLNLKSFLRPPAPPFYKSQHPNGNIYSSGRYWSC